MSVSNDIKVTTTSQNVTISEQPVHNFRILAIPRLFSHIELIPSGKLSQIGSLKKENFSTKDNTPAMPLNDAHLVGFFHFKGLV